MSQWTCRRILAGLAPPAVHSRVDIERNVEDFLSRHGHLLHVSGIVVSLESLIDKPLVSLVDVQLVEPLAPFALCKGFLGQRRMVAGTLEHSYLVLYLHHDDGMLLTVNIGDMAEQGGESLPVGIEDVSRKGRSYLQRLAGGCHSTWESPRILLQPQRRIAAHGVLPRTEPQEDDFQIVPPCQIDSLVDKREIELTLSGFRKVPLRRHEHCIESFAAHAWQNAIDIGLARCRRITQFARKHNHRTAIDGDTAAWAVARNAHLSGRRQHNEGRQDHKGK